MISPRIMFIAALTCLMHPLFATDKIPSQQRPDFTRALRAIKRSRSAGPRILSSQHHKIPSSPLIPRSVSAGAQHQPQSSPEVPPQDAPRVFSNTQSTSVHERAALDAEIIEQHLKNTKALRETFENHMPENFCGLAMISAVFGRFFDASAQGYDVLITMITAYLGAKLTQELMLRACISQANGNAFDGILFNAAAFLNHVACQNGTELFKRLFTSFATKTPLSPHERAKKHFGQFLATMLPIIRCEAAFRNATATTIGSHTPLSEQARSLISADAAECHYTGFMP